MTLAQRIEDSILTLQLQGSIARDHIERWCFQQQIARSQCALRRLDARAAAKAKRDEDAYLESVALDPSVDRGAHTWSSLRMMTHERELAAGGFTRAAAVALRP